VVKFSGKKGATKSQTELTVCAVGSVFGIASPRPLLTKYQLYCNCISTSSSDQISAIL
jgi:hypothetical protein